MNKTYKKLLEKFISFKSISTSSEYEDNINKTVDWLEELFEDNGFEVKIIRGYDNPVITASFEVDADLDTALIYGHYDVQPAQKSDGWDSEPFELTQRDGRLYGRGVVDNKGQVLVHMATIFDLIKKNELKYNIKFILEGNEETGSPNIKQAIKDYKDLLDCDFVMISDGEITADHPTIEAGFRGGFNATVKIQTSDKELHSGLYGSASPSASGEMVDFLELIHDEDNSVSIDGFYEDVDEIDEQILDLHEQIPFDMDEYEELSGTKALLTEDDYDFYTQTGLRPAIVITGLQAGYVGDGYRNSIPAEAMAKINFRLVKSQDPEDMAELFNEFVEDNMPEYVDYEIDVASPYEGIKLDLANKYVESAKKYLTDAFGVDALVKFCGGGLPIVTHFDAVLGVPQVLAPLGNEDCAMHAANENYNLDVLEKALDFSYKFWSKS